MTSALEAIKLKIRNELNRITDDTINGACTDFANYRFACGIAHGLAYAEDIVKEIEAKLYAIDEDDDTGED